MNIILFCLVKIILCFLVRSLHHLCLFCVFQWQNVFLQVAQIMGANYAFTQVFKSEEIWNLILTEAVQVICGLGKLLKLL